MCESKEELELQNVDLGVISREMAFETVVLDDIKTECREGTLCKLRLKTHKQLHIR